jgi:hypothetical protein
MRTRSHYVLCLLLVFALAGCSSKSANNTTSQPSDSSAANSSGSSGGNAANSPAGSPASAPQQAQQAPAPPPPVVIPKGTSINVRLDEALGSKLSSPGQSFSATVDEAVEVDGNTVIPVGAAARGTVVDAKPLGRFKGGAVLEVRLTSIKVNGVERSIETTAVERTMKGKGKRTAVLAGGGGALGAIIGGIAGGGKGAAIGALAGGGAGGAGAAFTGNKEIVFPVETKLAFGLKEPLEIKQAQ